MNWFFQNFQQRLRHFLRHPRYALRAPVHFRAGRRMIEKLARMPRPFARGQSPMLHSITSDALHRCAGPGPLRCGPRPGSALPSECWSRLRQSAL